MPDTTPEILPISESVQSQQTVDIENYLSQLDWQVKENSNTSYSLQGLNAYISGQASKQYWLSNVYPDEVKDAHESAALHIHDLNQVSVYCVGWDLQSLLNEGFGGVSGKVDALPAKHLRTALGQVVNFLYTLQGEAAGAQAFANFDTLLAPFIHFDQLSREQVRQALQEFLFNINVPTRVGFQTPFTNITLDLTCPKHLAKTPVSIGGQLMLETYDQFQAEMNLFNEVFFELMTEGDACGRLFSFPIPTINITPDFDWEADHLETLWEATAKYGIPYFANFVNSDMSPDDARSMCCRLRIDNTELRKRGGGLFGANPLTGSIGVVTLNLPRIAYNAESETEFFDELAHLMDLARDSLEIKRSVLERLTRARLYPYAARYLQGIFERFGKYWENHFSTIGLLGMNEACENLIGASISSPDGHAFAQRALTFMRDRLSEYQDTTGNLYNLEATPGESTSYRFARSDHDRHPNIISAQKDPTAQPYYTNSTHLPVGFSEDLFSVLDHQEALQTLYTGGTVLHGFLGERLCDTRAVKKLIKSVMENYSLPYFSITPTFSICPEHGYLSGEHPECPHCQRETEVYSRIVGYLRPVSQWNDGKQAEYEDRKTYQAPTHKAMAS
ncbi:MAG: ribonucleoside triphosphate reductase [Opitutales bacterium]